MTGARVALAEVAELNPRLDVNRRPKLQDLVSFVPMASVSESSQAIEQPMDREYAEVAKGYTAFKRGDILIAKITPCFENGKMAHAMDLPREFGFGSTEFHVVRPGPKLDGRFLFQLLRGPTVRLVGAGRMKGAAGQRRVPAEFFADLQIPLPSVEEQKRIAKILDAADALRAKRRESIALLDTLLQSTFLDMFGDPVLNTRGWKQLTLQETNSQVQVGPFGSLLHKHDYVTDGVPLINPMHIIDGSICPRSEYSVSEEKSWDLSGYRLRTGDVIMGRRGEMGRCAVVTEAEAGMLCGTGSLFVRPSPEHFLSFYLFALLSSEPMKRLFEQLAQGVTMPNLNRRKVETLKIPVPPIGIQRKLVDIAQSINHQKSLMQSHLTELDTLFASLQHRAFNGEL